MIKADGTIYKGIGIKVKDGFGIEKISDGTVYIENGEKVIKW